MNCFGKYKVFVIFSFFLFIFTPVHQGTVQAYYGGGYYGSMNGGIYGFGGLYGGGLYGGLYNRMYGLSGLYGGGLLGSGLYRADLLGGIYNPYNSYASNGLLGNNFFYNTGQYGGLGSLNNWSGLNMPGLRSLGLNWLGKLGMFGMYGGGGPFGGGLYGSMYTGLSGLGGILGGLRNANGLAEQAGAWIGLWSNGISSGSMTLNIVEDPVNPIVLAGVVQLIGNTLLTNPVDVTGEFIDNQVILTGICSGLGNWPTTIDIVGTLISPTELAGNYTLTKQLAVIQTGTFELTLTTPVL